MGVKGNREIDIQYKKVVKQRNKKNNGKGQKKERKKIFDEERKWKNGER